MKCAAFATSLLLVAMGGHAASIGDAIIIHEVDDLRHVVPDDALTVPENVKVVAGEHILVPEDALEMSGHPKSESEEVVTVDVPYEYEEVMGDHIADDAPVAVDEENCGGSSRDVMDVQSADRAEEVANEDLLDALDSVLANGETITDVMKSEGAPMPVTAEV